MEHVVASDQSHTSQPLVEALQRRDKDLLGILADHPRSVALHNTLGPGAVLEATLPIWRRHRLARDDWDITAQIFAMRALILGVALTLIDPAANAVTPRDPMDVVGASITALLGPESANKNEIQFAANEIIEFLRRAQAAAIEFIDSPQAPT